jgi:hypothetical protein
LIKIHDIVLKNDDATQPKHPKVGNPIMDKFLTKKSTSETIAKLAAKDGISFHTIATSEYIQESMISNQKCYDKKCPTSPMV